MPTMSRYLTPPKVGLLALISLYSDFVIPSAATIPILSFLVSHLLPPGPGQPHTASTVPKHSNRAVIDGLQQVTIGHASGIPGRTVWDLVLNKLWEINSFDALHVFLNNLSLLLEKPREEQDAEDLGAQKASRIRLSRASPLGAFVRRSQLEFTRLQFHDGIALWQNFVTYRNPTLPQWRRRHPGVGNNADVNLQEAAGEPTDRIWNVVYGGPGFEGRKETSFSTDDVEKLLEYQVDQMQSMPHIDLFPRSSQPLTTKQRWAIDYRRK